MKFSATITLLTSAAALLTIVITISIAGCSSSAENGPLLSPDVAKVVEGTSSPEGEHPLEVGLPPNRVEPGESGDKSLTERAIPLADCEPRRPYLVSDTSGYLLVANFIKRYPPDSSLEEVSKAWSQAPGTAIQEFEKILRMENLTPEQSVEAGVWRAMLWNFDGKPDRGLETLSKIRAQVEGDPKLVMNYLYSLVYLQGISALRQGETENCILCRGESSCILPISAAARHTNETGSRLAVKYFHEYLEQFPDDLEVRWLLNVAHMTLGEHPKKVDPRFLISLDKFEHSEFNIGKFRDVGHLVGLDRLNRQGGGIMEDFNNDGLLDIVTTANEPFVSATLYLNKGDGSFEERTKAAALSDQFMGLYCVQADYNNDGLTDIFVPRGSWLRDPVRPSLLRNDGNGTFSDVTSEARLDASSNSLSACWADYDNDGFLDLFVPCRQLCKLYRNKRDGTFEEVAKQSGVAGTDAIFDKWKSASWIDFDNDGDQDLFVNVMGAAAILYRNNGNGAFTDATGEMKIDGPKVGFACWSWDYDNDGWLDIFATCYEYPLDDIVLGLIGKPHKCESNRLYRNLGGKGFQDVTKETGMDMVFATMGSNFGDFDNDGYLDMYLGTGGPDLAVLVPNRMFKNVQGKRFAEITASARTGNLQKGHSVACGDWDRNGTLDIFIEMGGVTPTDRYHNILFQNPGQGNHWLNVKLVGKRSNKSAIGARIKAITAGEQPQTICQQVSTGSSFGANPLEQHLGLARATQVATLEIHWPTSGTTQVFHDIPADQALEITEFAEDYKTLKYKPIPLPKE
jgi:hypothetical protein